MKIRLEDLPKPHPDKSGWPWTSGSDQLAGKRPDGADWPRISIVMPSYNQAEYIEEAIRSVLLQGYPNLEFIIMDGGSTDGSVEIIEKYGPWLTYWVSESDHGQTHALNTGMTHCTGEVFNWLNSDDYYELGVLAEVGTVFSRDARLNVLCGRLFMVFPDGKIQDVGRTKIRETIEATIVVAHGEWLQPSTFFRRSALFEIGPLNEQLHYVFDAEMWIRFLLLHGLGGIGFSTAPLVNYRVHDQSKTGAVLMQQGADADFDGRYGKERRALQHAVFLLSGLPDQFAPCPSVISDSEVLGIAEGIVLGWEAGKTNFDHVGLQREFRKQYFLKCFAASDYSGARKTVKELWLCQPWNIDFTLMKISCLFPASFIKRAMLVKRMLSSRKLSAEPVVKEN